MLNLALVGVGDAHARHRLRVRTGAPHPRGRLPIAIVVLHLGPDEVVARVRHRAIRRRIGRAEQRAAGDLPALHHLDLDRIPDFRSRRRVEGRSVLPGSGIEGALIDGAGRRDPARVAVLACGRGERELRGARIGVVGVRIGRRRRLCLRAWRLGRKRCQTERGTHNHGEIQVLHGHSPISTGITWHFTDRFRSTTG